MAGYSIYIYHITLDEANRVRRELGLPELSEEGSAFVAAGEADSEGAHLQRSETVHAQGVNRLELWANCRQAVNQRGKRRQRDFAPCPSPRRPSRHLDCVMRRCVGGRTELADCAGVDEPAAGGNSSRPAIRDSGKRRRTAAGGGLSAVLAREI